MESVLVGRTRLFAVALCLWAGCAAPDKPRSADGGFDGMTPGDGAQPADLAVPIDLSELPDLAPPPDFAAPPDLMPACIDAGTVCNTGNPGACALGRAVCVNNMLTCIPDATTQPCYTGPAGSQNIGICRGGTQSCVGGLGACMGEVRPAQYENCFNNLDDDCNNLLNDGCPDTVSVGNPRALPAQGGSGGGPVSARCPANSFVVHTQFFFDHQDSTASGVQIFCSTPTLVRGASSYSVSLSGQVAGASWKGSTTSFLDGEIDCGTAAFVGGWRTRGYASNYVYGMGLDCASGALSLAANNTLSISFAPNGNGNYWFYSTGSFFQIDCAANEVLVGYDGRIGSWMDQLTPICAPLVVGYK
jgi:hypothetical protein